MNKIQTVICPPHLEPDKIGTVQEFSNPSLEHSAMLVAENEEVKLDPGDRAIMVYTASGWRVQWPATLSARMGAEPGGNMAEAAAHFQIPRTRVVDSVGQA
jgi:hypothetical protein